GLPFPMSGDTTGYHMEIVSWLNNFSLVPGLANLHFRLGSYSGYLDFSAVIDNYIWDNKSPFVMPGLFFFGFCMYFIWEFFLSLSKKNKGIKTKIWNIFYATPLLLASSYYYFGTFNSGPNLYYDILPMFLFAIILNEIMKLFFSKHKNNEIFLLNPLFVISAFSIIAYLSKQSNALVLLLVSLFSVYLLFKNSLLNIKNFFRIFLIPILGFLGSIVSNLITSGYPLFPLPFIKVNFPWTASIDSINQAYVSIKYWAKLPGENYMSVANNSFLYWFIPWIKRNMADPLFINLAFIPLVCGLLIWLINIFFCIRKKQKYYWLFILVTLNLIYWFLMAPDIRFGIMFFVVFFSTGFAVLLLLIYTYNEIAFKKIFNKYNLTVVFLFTGLISIWLFRVSKLDKKFIEIKNYYNVNFVDSNEFYEKEMKTKNGGSITVYIPKDNECRSFPLPCTPYYSKNIKAFNGNNLGTGFYYEGDEK
ncbi:MAG: hypothetical protein NTU76_01000, partial [Candidatus Taylorbacteria bacterium]|nr:hypothetical protein [Candidatus Taylorbacteria bacterium]